MIRWKSLVRITKRAFSSIEKPLEFLDECKKCDIKYRMIRKPKKSGGVRIIHAPSKELADIQREILRIIGFWHVDMCQFGFIEDKSCRDNALAHIHKNSQRVSRRETSKIPRWMLRIDLKDAFPSVRQENLEELFRAMLSPLKNNDFLNVGRENMLSVYEELVYQFTRLTTYQGRMPQGAPSSPYLLNLILFHSGIVEKLKAKGQERVKKLHRIDCAITPFVLSIYADDIVFTSFKDRIPNRFIRDVIAIIEEGGIFKINPDKIHRSSSKYKAHLITGIVLDSTWRSGGRYPITLPQKIRKTYRGKLHRVTAILKSGRLPDSERDGINIDQALGIRSRIRDVFRKQPLPPELKKGLEEFEIAWNIFKTELL